MTNRKIAFKLDRPLITFKLEVATFPFLLFTKTYTKARRKAWKGMPQSYVTIYWDMKFDDCPGAASAVISERKRLWEIFEAKLA